MTLRRSTFRYVEQEIYAYKETKKHLDEITNDIIHRTPPYQEIRSSDTSDPTAMTATILGTHKARLRMVEAIYAIDITMIEYPHEKRDVLEYKYWAKPYKRWEDVAEHFHLNRRTLYRWRTAFVEDVAKRMGIY